MIDDSCVSRPPDINRKHSRIVKADGKSVNMVDLYPEATAKLINTNVIKNSKAELNKKLSNLSIESVR
ncbi:MAG TPA: hypothetical protein VLM20_06220 [Methylophilaceae bacterium]|nr:hypothetical protein [Methylophilaceae bacterium]